jgi:4-amino-4-deoxychorismate lyase
MCLLVESIKIQNRILQNIDAHNVRFNQTRHALFGQSEMLDLRNFIHIPDYLDNGIYKCRVIYGTSVREVILHQYSPRIIKTLEIVDGDDIDYEFKYLDKTRIESLRKLSGADDILIVKNGFITDASFANIVLFDGNLWITPATPLLRGTKRQSLLEAGIISEYEIKEEDLPRFQKAVLVNAMLDFDPDNFISIENVRRRRMLPGAGIQRLKIH